MGEIRNLPCYCGVEKSGEWKNFHTKGCTLARNEIQSLRERLGKAKTTLREYGQHRDGCMANELRHASCGSDCCNCGYEDALSAIEGEK